MAVPLASGERFSEWSTSTTRQTIAHEEDLKVLTTIGIGRSIKIRKRSAAENDWRKRRMERS